MDGKKVKYQLGIPKGDTHTWEDTEVEFPYPVSETKTLTAHWTLNTYTITFNGAGGSETALIEQAFGTEIDPPADPAREHYTFKGWSPTLPSTMPAENLTVTAIWEPTVYRISFDSNGGSEIAPIEAIYGAKVEAPEDPTRGGYVFNGWLNEKDAPAVFPLYMPDGNPTYVASWKEIDRSALRDALQEIRRIGRPFVSADGRDVPDGAAYVLQPDEDAFNQAVTNARSVLEDPEATLSDIEASVAALSEALNAYNDARKIASVDRSALEEAVAAADSTGKNVVASVDGSDVDPEEKWVTPEQRQAFDDAVSAARAVAADPSATQAMIDEALTTLAKAAEDLEAAGKNGMKANPAPAADKPTPLDETVDKVLAAKNDGDIAESAYAPLKLLSKKQTKKSIKLAWSSVKGAKKYVVFGNLSGKNNRYKKLAEVNAPAKSFNVKSVLDAKGKKVKLKKGKYYKFVIVADMGADGSKISKTIHVATKGKKKASNNTKVKVSKKVLGKAKKLKVGKSLKLKAKALKKSGTKVKRKAKLRYESSDESIASVSKSGKVKAKKKGSCYVYAYAQNGVCKKVKVKVR